MQKEINSANPRLPVHIFGVNETGQESGNGDMCFGRVLPWLQDTADQNVWGRWAVRWRDVVVLDVENSVRQVYNLTTYDLSKPENYATLKTILLDAAR